MIKYKNEEKNGFTLRGIYDSKELDSNIIKTNNKVTEFVEKKEAFIYLGKKDKMTYKSMKAALNSIASLNTREYQIDVNSFVTDKVSESDVASLLAEVVGFLNAKLYNVKTKKKDAKKALTIFNVSDEAKKAFEESKLSEDARSFTRNLQITPPNVLTSEQFAKDVEAEFKSISNVGVTVLNKKQIQENKMGLLLSVNLGSHYEPRVVILEYKGDASSKNKTVLVGKGIVYDAGGYNIKTGSHMGGMKYDMSGAAIAAGVMKSIADVKPKSNFSVVLVITDNMINSIASTPDAVFTSMNGKTVEINNTDAEGRLALADGLTYAVRKLNATRLIDIATLTGAVLSALGNTYSGVWATTDKAWELMDKAATAAHENIWRMPFHEDYLKFMKGSDVADLKNTDLTGMGGSSTAGMFLKEFTEGVEYIHMDVAGTADVKHKPMGAMLKTLVEMSKNGS